MQPINMEAIQNLADFTDNASMNLLSYVESENYYISLEGTFKISTEKGCKFEYLVELLKNPTESAKNKLLRLSYVNAMSYNVLNNIELNKFDKLIASYSVDIKE